MPGCCQETSKKYLFFLNTLIAISGLGLTSLGVYILIAKKDLVATVSGYAVYSPVGIGIGVFAVAMMGCMGSKQRSKPLLVLYWVFLTLMALLSLAAGLAFLVYAGSLDSFQGGTAITTVIGGTKSIINDYQLAIYQECCFAKNLTTIPVELCVSGTNTIGCINDATFYNDALDTLVGDATCVSLANVKFNGATLLPNACIDPLAFAGAVSSVVQSNALIVGSVILSISALLFLADVFTCVLICTNRPQYDEEYERKMQQQQINGQQLSGITYVQ